MRPSRSLVLAGFVLLVGGLASCADSAPPADDTAVTYYQHAAPLLGRYCNGCHTDGGIAPFALGSYASAKAHAATMRDAVASDRMPPWLASDAGLPLRYSHKLLPEHKALLLRWLDAGAPLGDPNGPAQLAVPPAETVAPPRPDLHLDPGQSYQPSGAVSDDYRCFVVSSELPGDIYVQAAEVHPGQKRLVHHVVVFQIPPAGVAKVKALLGKDGQPGYTCFGGAGADDDARVLMAWAPGGVPARFPEGTALKVAAGSLLVMQVHYNLSNSHGAGDTDRSTADLELSPAAPERLAQIWPIADPDGLLIKAGDPAAHQTVRLDVWLLEAYFGFPSGDLLLYGSAPHMHLLGHRQTLAVDNGPLLLEVPRWDFHWQLPYSFVEPYLLRPQDTLVLDCQFDNSAANQPMVAGQPQTPRDVRWGEGTLDEMCLNFVYVAPVPKTP